jgi:hypothetical protein
MFTIMEKKSQPKSRTMRSRRKNRQEKPATAPSARSAHADLRFRTPLFPPRFRKRLMYCENALTVTSNTGLVASYFFAANGLYDPNVTGTGHQPMGFDEMMSMYEQYTVLSSKITVHYINGSGVGVYGAAILYLSPDTSSITAFSRLQENGFLVWKALYPISVVGSQCQLSMDCDIPTYFGRNRDKRAIVDDAQLAGAAASNPAELVYFTVAAVDAAGANTVQLSFSVEIEYEVIFWEPRKLTQS